jgi:hypothetical protein
VSPSCQLKPPFLITTYHLTPLRENHQTTHTYHLHALTSHSTTHYTSHSTTALCLHLHYTVYTSHPHQQTTLARTYGRPHQQGHVEDHINKYTWHNQMMTSVKRKLTWAMSTSDVRKLCHSGRFTSEVSSPTNVKSLEVLKDEVLNSLSVV